MIKLIASDLDGTLLLNGAQELKSETMDLIEALHRKGIIFVPASGRQLDSLEKLFAPVRDEIAYICENGSLVFYKEELIAQTAMDRDLSLEIIDDIKNREGCEVLISCPKHGYLMSDNKEYLNHMINNVHFNAKIINDVSQIDQDFVKISAYQKAGIDKSSKYFIDKWGNKSKTTVSGKCWIDFTDLSANKGEALKSIQKLFDISPEETMVFGDNFNDLEMFAVAKYSYVMEHAVAEVRSRAKYQTDRVENVLQEVLKK